MRKSWDVSADDKVNRVKLKKKLATLTRKAVALSTECHCEILLIVYSKPTKEWTQYCSSDASNLFFSFQKANEHLDSLEKCMGQNLEKLLNSVCKEETSPLPKKFAKIEEGLSQPIKIAEKAADMQKSWSTQSTNFTFLTKPDHFPVKIQPTSHVAMKVQKDISEKSLFELDSSLDFDFESYFDG